ncbi:MAG TPA: hypothetical protein VGM06_20955 [Polyangiaceae bacterium]|jgi:hypothetical protein
MKLEQVEELVLQSLEHEMGGVHVYSTALKCAANEDLKEEWEKYLEQTRGHVQKLKEVCRALGIDADRETSGRKVVRHLGEALVDAMKRALGAGDPVAAELVACECVVLAETKDHLDWELLGKCAEHVAGKKGDVLRDACEEVEDQEDEHLYHTRGWCRELWCQSLELKAVLPPPEERRHVKTAIGAARAEQSVTKR